MDDTVIIAHVWNALQPNRASLCTQMPTSMPVLSRSGAIGLHMIDEMMQSLT